MLLKNNLGAWDALGTLGESLCHLFGISR